MDAKARLRRITFRLAGRWTAEKLHVWRTTQREQFIRMPDVR